MEREQLIVLLDQIPIGIIATDPEGRVAYANKAGQPFIEKIDRLPLARALAGEICDDVEITVEPRGLLIRAIARCAKDTRGAITGAIVVFEDVTARRRAEDDLKNANLFLDSIIENVPNMIFVKEGRELRFERFNRAGETLLGLSREQLLGKNDYDLFPADQADHFQARDRETLERGILVDIPEEPIDTHQGQRILHTQKVPILDAFGHPKYLLGISEDITEKKAAAEEEKRQTQKLEALGTLAGGVAHDFNNMLSVILSCAEMIPLEGEEAASIRDDVQQIIAAGKRAATLTQKLLAFSRRQVPKPALLELGDVVQGMADMVRRLIGEDIQLSIEVEPSIGLVLMDRGQLEQAILNLAVNARDAMEGRETRVLTISTRSGEKEQLELAVSDTGVGMNNETIARMFEPFFTTKADGKGTGLGLAMVYGIVKQNGGDIRVESQPGNGTTFRMFLPRIQGQLGEVPHREDAARGGRDTVLLVEDEPLVRATAVRVLQSRGYVVLQASVASEAIELATNYDGTIHLLLSDVILPGMNGRELAVELLKARPSMRTLFMSGYTDDVVSRSGVLPGDMAFIAKPFTPDALARKIRQVLET